MRRQNQRMSRKDDQPSAASAVAFLQRKKRRLIATVLRLFAAQIQAKTPFSLREGFAVGVGFFGTFLPSKKYEEKKFLGASR